MSRTLNKVMLIGNVGKEPDMKFTPSGIPVASFRLATSETWRDRSGNVQEHTDWHTIVAWRGLAEVCHKLLRKGARIYIEGKLQTRTIEDKNNFKRQLVEIVADNMLLLDGKKYRENGGDEPIKATNFYESGFDDSDFDSEFGDLSGSITDIYDNDNDDDSFDMGKYRNEIPF